MFGPIILPLDQAVTAVASSERLAQAGVASEQAKVLTQVHRFAVGRDAAGAVVLGHSSHSSHASHASHSSSSGGGVGWPSPATPVYSGLPVVTVPAAPSGVLAAASDGTASLSWAPVYAGGGSVTYLITAFPGGAMRTVVDVSTAQFDGLENGVAYSFVVVATTIAGEGPGSLPTAPVTPLAPQLEAQVPVIVGKPAVGRQLRAEAPGWASGTALSYQWTVGGRDVSGASERSFRPTASMAGERVAVVVTGVNAAYANGASAVSTSTLKIARVGHLSVTGSGRVGTTLRAHRGKWVHGTTFRFTWLVGGKPVRHSGPSLLVLPSYAGKRITVRVTGHQNGYADFVVHGSATRKVHV